MPPKRKNKATKALATTAQPKTQSAAGIRTSSIKRRNSVQGVKTSRLQPSEPLHMTTRGAAKAASTHNSSAAPSVASSSSRRGSLNDLAQFDDGHSDVEDERPAKRSRVSTDSGSTLNSTGSFTDQIPVTETQTPEEPTPMSRAASNASKTSSKKRRASGDSSESSKTVSARPNGVLARSESDVSEKQPRRKKRKTVEAEPEPTEQPPELTDASTAPNSPEQIPEIESTQVLQNVLPTTNGDAPAKPGRRLPGRRRQPHADVNVETDLRRQLNIKMSYRSLAKIQKTLLEELSSRTTSNLEKDPEYYKQCPEYTALVAALDQHRQNRLDQVHAERRLKLEQLERVRVAEERIEKEQYINRVKELQEDFLLQCYHRMKQLEREIKGQDGNATDDEENIIAPTHMDFPTYGADDRLGSKYASRSRAYIETERIIDREAVRDQLQRQQKAFMAEHVDLDSSVGTLPSGFAAFNGPDRTEAIAHYNMAQLVDAAFEFERTSPKPEPPSVIPNEQADALFLLASLSAERPPEMPIRADQQQPPTPPAQITTPAPEIELNRELSPFEPLSTTSTAMSLETAKSSPTKPSHVEDDPPTHIIPHQETNGSATGKEAKVVKNETPTKVSTHRIMDLLNDDQDVPVPKARETQPLAYEKTPCATPSRRESASQSQPSQNAQLRLDAIVHNHEQLEDDQPIMMDEDDTTLPQIRSPPPSNQFWSNRNIGGSRDHSSEHMLPKMNPLDRIRDMLHRKARAEGKPPPPDFRRAPSDRRTERDPSSDHRLDAPATHRDIVDRSHMVAPPLSRAFSPQERSDTAGRDSRRPSVGGYSASPSTAPVSYNQSPRASHAYPQPPPQHNSQDQGSPYWDQGRRMSGSQVPPTSQYSGSPAQSYPSDYHRAGPTPPAHQSPYPPPSAPQLPSFSQTLPAKPPGPPPAAPINFRFAHYDPAPPRHAYPPQSPANYPPVSHPPQSGPQPLPQYTTPYSAPPSYQGYVPPPGSFQAPPPPTQNMSPYPPLKIHQYGGQPILPANMAPPPPHSQPPMNYMAQPPPASGPPYSPQGPLQGHPFPRNPQFEHISNAPRDGPPERPPEPQSRPRRQYRSYHAPGTQFRTYQGPDSGRRRGG